MACLDDGAVALAEFLQPTLDGGHENADQDARYEDAKERREEQRDHEARSGGSADEIRDGAGIERGEEGAPYGVEEIEARLGRPAVKRDRDGNDHDDAQRGPEQAHDQGGRAARGEIVELDSERDLGSSIGPRASPCAAPAAVPVGTRIALARRGGSVGSGGVPGGAGSQGVQMDCE